MQAEVGDCSTQSGAANCHQQVLLAREIADRVAVSGMADETVRAGRLVDHIATQPDLIDQSMAELEGKSMPQLHRGLPAPTHVLEKPGMPWYDLIPWADRCGTRCRRPLPALGGAGVATGTRGKAPYRRTGERGAGIRFWGRRNGPWEPGAPPWRLP
jgi:hypothetical protein